MNAIQRTLVVAGGLALASILGACGGSGDGGCKSPTGPGCSPSPVAVTPTPRPPVVMDSGQGNLPALVGLFRSLATTETGSFDVTVDWTFAANDIDVVLARGNCSFDQFVSNQCSVAASATSAITKPERLRLANQPAGTYTLIVVNLGPGDESIAYQAVFTAGTSAASAVQGAARIAPEKIKPLRRGIVEPD